MNETTLVLCIHNHQPVGNLPGVFEDAYRSAYLPFLEAIENFPDVKVVLHNSGPLLEWFEDHAQDYIERVRRLVERGQVEILTGGFYEPILSSIPERDARGQIEMMSEYVSRRFGVRPRGMWLAERVWEPRLAKTIGEAGVEYLPLDDYEFRLAGLPDEDLVGSFITEDQGVPVSVFPISKRLRYAIPFADPEETVEAMRELAERGTGLVAVFGDDGEKFGVWPGTHAHVYRGGWLKRFLSALSENGDWLKTATFSEVADRLPARGRVYLPTSSYPEMMEWALPTPARRQYESFLNTLRAEGREDDWGPFVSGGTWKSFLSKYEESNLMVRKMMRVSAKVARAERAGQVLRELEDLPGVVRAAGTGPSAIAPEALDEARRELWMGQCNCAYWHGVFGGLYLPHLRAAIYEHLIRSEERLEYTRGANWACAEVIDHDLDGVDEVLLESERANVYVGPARGGSIFEIDIKRAAWNLLGTMAPYVEAYHGCEVDAASDADGTAKSIHDCVTAKEENLDLLAVESARSKRSAVDHFFPNGVKLADIESGDAELARDAETPREFEVRHADDSVGLWLGCVVQLDGGPDRASVGLEKTISLRRGGVVRVEHRVSPQCKVDAAFASEWNFSFLTGDREWVVAESPDIEPFGLRRRRSIDQTDSITLVDRIRGEALTLSLEPAGRLCFFPIETGSQSEGGLERVFQGVTVYALWDLRESAGGRESFTIELESRALKED